MSDLSEMTAELAAEVRLSALSEDTTPRESIAVMWLNDGVALVELALRPRWTSSGLWLPKGFFKLAKITEKETYTIPVGYADYMVPLPTVGGSGFAPGTAGPVGFIYGVTIGLNVTDVWRYRPARQRPLAEVWRRLSGDLAAPADAPIFAWGNYAIAGSGTTPGIIPAPQLAAGQTVDFYFLKKFARLAVGGVTDFPLDNDLMVDVLDYGRMMLWASRNGLDLGRAVFYRKRFMERLVERRGPYGG